MVAASDIERSEIEVGITNTLDKTLDIADAYYEYGGTKGIRSAPAGPENACGMLHTEPKQRGGYADTLSVEPGETFYILCNPGSGELFHFPEGEKVRVDFGFVYMIDGGFEHPVEGEVYATVQG